jgi:hypothetical protein
VNFAEIVNLLAASHDIQVRYLQPVPENAGAPSFTRGNNVYRMLVLYSRSCAVDEGEGGTEGLDSWMRRTQLPPELVSDRKHPVWAANNHLFTATNMLQRLGRDFFYSVHGLRSAHEWKLVRYLAGEVLGASGWPRVLVFSNFSQLWDALGGGVIECRCEGHPTSRGR